MMKKRQFFPCYQLVWHNFRVTHVRHRQHANVFELAEISSNITPYKNRIVTYSVHTESPLDCNETIGKVYKVMVMANNAPSDV